MARQTQARLKVLRLKSGRLGAGVVRVQARLKVLRLGAGRLNAVLPNAPSAPIPAHGYVGGPYELRWSSTTAQTYEVYFGTSPTPALVGSVTTPRIALPPLTDGTVYYWRVVAHSSFGARTSPTWSLTARAPTAPVLVSPADHSVNQSRTPTLTWQAVTNVTDAYYEVRLGTSTSQPALVATLAHPTASYTVGTPLAIGVAYHWRVDARNNAGRHGSVTWTFTTTNTTALVISIGGATLVRVRRAGIAIHDVMNAANTASFTVEGSAPTVGQDVRVGIGSLNASDLIFGGTITSVESVYEGVTRNRAWRVSCEDYTNALNRRKVRRRYAQQSATAIALDLMARDAPPGFATTGIVAGLPTIEGGIDFTDEDFVQCFARLAERIGGYWYVDYARAVHLYTEELSNAPEPILPDTRLLLNDPPIAQTTDVSQIRTRVYVEGGGSQAREQINVGATSIPVTDGTWYSGAGGLVVSGPQRIRYTGKGVTGGPGAPTAAATLVAGNLIGGPYLYKVTTIAGSESPLSGPSNAVTLLQVVEPSSAPSVSPGGFDAPTSAPDATRVVGGSMASGSYDWRATFATNAGETTVGPTSVVVSLGPETTGGLDPNAGSVAPAERPTDWGGPDVGSHAYYTTALNAAGETTPRFAANYFAPSLAVPVVSGINGPGAGSLIYTYVMTYATALGETTRSDSRSFIVSQPISTSAGMTLSGLPLGPNNVTRKLYRSKGATSGGHPDLFAWGLVATLAAGVTQITDTVPDASRGPAPPTTNTAGACAVNLVIVRHGGAGVTKRRVYRTPTTGGTAKLVLEVDGDPANLTVVDTLKDSSLGVAAPTENTTGTTTTYASASLTNIPIGPSGTTKRKLYRWLATAGEYRLTATINDNTTTTYTDSKADASLGAAPPTTNTIGGALGIGRYWWGVSFATANGETLTGPLVAFDVTTGAATLTGIPTSSDGRVTQRRVYRTAVNGGPLLLEATLNDNTTTTLTSAGADGALGASSPVANTTGGARVTLTNIAIGGGATTARKVYRTVAGGGEFRFLVTLNDNTTTTYDDNKADAALGEVAPGDLLVELTGVPASGAGSVLYPLKTGDELNLYVQCDDVTAQNELKALEGASSDGVVEHVIQDRRVGLAQATARGNAELALFARPLRTVTYATRDPKTRTGKTVRIALPSVGIDGEFVIQSVELDELDEAPGLQPRYRVSASSVKFTIEDVLRRLQLES